MAVRVTEDEVSAIIETTITTAQMDAYIESASAMVDGWFNSVSISDSLLKEIERWIAAHLIAITRERQAREEGAGGAYIKYTGMTGTLLKSTTYGQQAIALDNTGTLSKLDLKPIKWYAVG